MTGFPERAIWFMNETLKMYLPNRRDNNNLKAGSGEPRISASFPINPTLSIFSSSTENKRGHYCQLKKLRKCGIFCLMTR